MVTVVERRKLVVLVEICPQRIRVACAEGSFPASWRGDARLDRRGFRR